MDSLDPNPISIFPEKLRTTNNILLFNNMIFERIDRIKGICDTCEKNTQNEIGDEVYYLFNCSPLTSEKQNHNCLRANVISL